MSRRLASRLLLALATGWALWTALNLLDILPFRLNLGDWSHLRFFGLNALGGVLWAIQAALWWWACLLAGEGRVTRRAIVSIAGANAALAVATVIGDATIQAVLPGLLFALGAALVTRGMPGQLASD